MKKHILLCMAIACTFFKPALAQIEKGKWVGGVTLYGSNLIYKPMSGAIQNNGNKFDDFSINTSIGRMVSKRWLLSAGLSYSYRHGSTFNSSTPDRNISQTDNEYGLSVSGSYFKSIMPNLFFSSNYSIGYSYGKTRVASIVTATTFQKTDNYSVIAAPIGISYLFKNKFLLQLYFVRLSFTSIHYNDYVAPSPDKGTIYNKFDYSFNPFLNGISISYIF